LNKLDKNMMRENVKEVLKDVADSLTSPLAFAASAGVVSKVCADEFEVTIGRKQYVCAKAASCLLKPEFGDTVLVQGIADAGVWILAVLVRSEMQEGHIQLPDSTVFSNRDGSITFRTKRLDVDADNIEFRSKRIAVLFDEMQAIGKSLNATIGAVKAIGRLMSTIADRITQHSHTYSRTTQGMDRTDAQQLEVNAEQMVRLKAPYVLVEGDNLVKTKGSQIHFG
jgi:Protein of unknown function (DUF3540)